MLSYPFPPASLVLNICYNKNEKRLGTYDKDTCYDKPERKDYV
jgi:hypothetical protein